MAHKEGAHLTFEEFAALRAVLALEDAGYPPLVVLTKHNDDLWDAQGGGCCVWLPVNREGLEHRV